MNQTLHTIYSDYQYQLWKLATQLQDAPETYADVGHFEEMALRFEKLECLIDLYAFLIAHRTSHTS